MRRKGENIGIQEETRENIGKQGKHRKTGGYGKT